MNSIDQHPKGSLRQLVAVSFPLMISAMSAHIMMFVDRLILSHYSPLAMSAVAAAGLVSYIFILSVSSIAAMSEVFVGQYNGAKQYKNTSIPVWQMIWFALGSSFIIYPITFLYGKFLIPEPLLEDGLPYFYWIMSFIPIFGCSSALSGFFAAIGRPTIITFAAIVSNIINLFFAVILIFGYKDIIPSFGAEGAGMASVIGIFSQFLILLFFYFSKSIREKYNTIKITWDKNTFFECIRVGYPNSIGHTLELLAWTFIFHVAALGGADFLIILTIGQNFLLMFAFLTEGMQKGALAISSNLIGSGDINKIDKLLGSAVKMQAIIVILLSIPLVLCSPILIQLFGIDSSSEILYKNAILSLLLIWIYFIFDGIVWVISGILTSAGDTKFIMVTNATCAWVCGVLPILIAIKYFSIEPYYLWMNTCLYCFINLIIFLLRYKFGNWKKLILVKQSTTNQIAA
jgi:MATE family multidrug resistance protein